MIVQVLTELPITAGPLRFEMVRSCSLPSVIVSPTIFSVAGFACAAGRPVSAGGRGSPHHGGPLIDRDLKVTSAVAIAPG
jgi:hypothetical protein